MVIQTTTTPLVSTTTTRSDTATSGTSSIAASTKPSITTAPSPSNTPSYYAQCGATTLRVSTTPLTTTPSDAATSGASSIAASTKPSITTAPTSSDPSSVQCGATTLHVSTPPPTTTRSDTATSGTSSIAAPTKSSITTAPTSSNLPSAQSGATTLHVSTTPPTTTWSDAATPGTVSIAASTTSSITTASTSDTAYVEFGAIVGGFGALVALVAIMLVIFRFRRRGHGNRATIDPDAEPFVPTDVQQRDAEPPSNHPTLQITDSSVPAALPAHQLGIENSNTSNLSNGGLSAPPHTDPSSNAFSSEASESSRHQARRVEQTQPILTDDQADFVNSLHANSVPATAIARVIERMMAGERRPNTEGYAAAEGSLQPEHDHGLDSAAPPHGYDHVSGWG
ncbi:hypothetical protein BU15DRAFT_80695 [Melanogaster broomeanus]|nr:hypothetical protein BU15DRAFT_80695 [Melanogaster broomeanus]